MELLREGGFWEDAAYIAERLISTDGLIRHVRGVAPEWQLETAERKEIDPQTCLTSGASFNQWEMNDDDRLRYLLGRRLAREYRYKESREFMPPELFPLLDHYIALDRARRAGKYRGEEMAAIVWRQALLHRHFGAQLFSTEGEPDGGARGWSFPAASFIGARIHRAGWTRKWGSYPGFVAAETPDAMPVPAITSDELQRLGEKRLSNEHRFHYRYRAADLAWQAAKSLPPNHPLLARLYNTAGQWLSVRDPKSADRFYQAMVRRCAKTAEGKAADERRWFLPDLAPLPSISALPEEFTK